MGRISVSRHAEARMQQRGMRENDVELLLENGTMFGSDVCFLSIRDADCAIRKRKREIQALERLINHKLVIGGDCIVTCYRSSRRDQKKFLRNGRDRT